MRTLTRKKIKELAKIIKEMEEKNKEHKDEDFLAWSQVISNTKSSFSRYYNFSKSITDESILINSIERTAARRALFYRILTTAGIGLTIMGIYALAHYLNIPMPLMRLPI